MKKTHVGVGANNHSPLRTTIYRSILYVCIGLIAGITIHTVSAWVEPDQMPPGGNIAAPLNTSNVGQSKSGGLVLNSGGATLGLLVERGNVVIGTNDPAMNSDLTVHGNIYGRNMNLNNNLNVGGDTNIGGNLTVNGNTNLHNTYVDGNLNVNGDIHGKNIYGDNFIVNNSNVSVGPSGLCNGTDCTNGTNGTNGADAGCPTGYMTITQKKSQSTTFTCVSENSRLCYGQGGSKLGNDCNAIIKLPYFYSEIKYIKGTKYTRAVMNIGSTNCDSGDVPSTEASCFSGQAGLKVKWVDSPGTAGYLISNMIWGGSWQGWNQSMAATGYLSKDGFIWNNIVDLRNWEYLESSQTVSPPAPDYSNNGINL